MKTTSSACLASTISKSPDIYKPILCNMYILQELKGTKIFQYNKNNK